METEMKSRIADPFSWDGHEAETLLACESGSGRAKELVAVVTVKTEGRPEAFYRVREAGEKDVDFESWLEVVDYYNCIGVESRPATPDTGIAKTELQDEDWKTAIAQKKPTIPAGAVVKITGTLQNMYGDFVKVEYNGVKYTVEPRKLDMPKTLEEQKQDKEWNGEVYTVKDEEGKERTYRPVQEPDEVDDDGEVLQWKTTGYEEEF